MRKIFFCIALLLSSPLSSTYAVEFGYPEPQPDNPLLQIQEKPKIAIVIDDLGYQRESGHLLSNLPFPITFAVIPDTPHANAVIDQAISSGQEVILHVPMETLNEHKWEQGLTTQMNFESIKASLADIFRRYPTAMGINNHGGSKLTADIERMAWVMESLAEHNLYFLDSRTTHESRAIEAATLTRVNHASRDVFLDNVKDADAVDLQFEKLKQIALQHGSAIGIGHPYPVTLDSLKKQLPLLKAQGFDLTFCSELLIHPNINTVKTASLPHTEAP